MKVKAARRLKQLHRSTQFAVYRSRGCIGRARVLYDKAKRSSVHVSVVAEYWGYSPRLAISR